MNGAIIDATDNDFAAHVASGVTLVDFWADWCGPCKALAPTLVDIAEDYAGEVGIVKVDIVANPATAERFAIQSIPALVLFRDGVELARNVGTLSKTRLSAFIDAHN